MDRMKADRGSREIISDKVGHVAAKIAVSVILALVGCFMLLPFAWMLSASFKKGIDIFSIPVV